MIRDRLLAKVGWASGGGVTDHYDELIREASVHVADECPWATAKRESRVQIQTDQRFVTYPLQCGAAGIIEIGLWIPEGQQYRRLSRHVISVVRQTDPTNDTGGAADVATRGEPVWFEPREQIEIYPHPDRAYELKIIYQLSVELITGVQTAACDAELILLWAAAKAYRQISDQDNANECMRDYARRLARLRARVQTSFEVPLYSEAMHDEENDSPRGYYATPT